jgi:hypothetical protein
LKYVKHSYATWDGENVIPTEDFRAWAQWFENNNPKRVVAKTDIGGGNFVSTVFLGMNHGFGKKDLWFETMVFGGPYSEEMKRYETLAEARIGHKAMVKMILEDD